MAGEVQHVTNQPLQVLQAFHRPLDQQRTIVGGDFGPPQTADIQQRRGQGRAQLMGQTGHHFPHGGQPLMPFRRLAHAMGFGDVVQQNDMLATLAQARVRDGQPPPLRAHLHAGFPGGDLEVQPAGDLWPGLAFQPTAQQGFGSLVGLINAPIGGNDQHPGGQGAHQHRQALTQVLQVLLQPGIGGNQAGGHEVKLIEGGSQLRGRFRRRYRRRQGRVGVSVIRTVSRR